MGSDLFHEVVRIEGSRDLFASPGGRTIDALVHECMRGDMGAQDARVVVLNDAMAIVHVVCSVTKFKELSDDACAFVVGYVGCVHDMHHRHADAAIGRHTLELKPLGRGGKCCDSRLSLPPQIEGCSNRYH